jgi:hypothetical protein
LFLLAAAPLVGQQVIYEDFSQGVRMFNYGGQSGPLFHPYTNAQYNACPAQTGAIENGQYAVRTQDCLGVDHLYWFVHNNYTGYTDLNGGFWRAWMMPGQTWNPSVNRFSFRFRCDYPAAADIQSNLHFGTFAKDPNNGDPYHNESDNYHFYHYVPFNMTPFRWIYVTVNDKPNHQRSGVYDGGLKVNPTHLPSYFDYLTKAYIDMRAATVDFGACHFDNLVFSQVAGEPDWYVSSVSGQHNGTRYEAGWQTPHQTKVIAYEVRSHTASMKSAGWSAGTSGGTVNSRGDGYTAVNWAGSNMAAAPGGMYIGIRPRMRPESIASGASTAMRLSGHGLQAGDGVACSGLTGLTPSTFTTTVGAVTDWENLTLAQATSGTWTPNTGYCTATSETSRFTEVFIPPDPVSAPMAPVSVSVTGTTATSASLSWTPDPVATSTVIERSITGAEVWVEAGTASGTSFTDAGLSAATSYDYRLRGRNASGTSGPTQVPAAALTANDTGAPAIGTSSLPVGTIGKAYSASISATGGAAPYTFSIISGTLPAGLSLTGSTITGTPTVITAEAGAAIRVKVAGDDGAASSVGLAVAINAAFPVTDSLAYPAGTFGAANWTKINYSQLLISTGAGLRSYNWQLAQWLHTAGWYADDQWAQAQVAALPQTGRVGIGVRMQHGQTPWGCAADAGNVCVRTAATSGTPVTYTCAAATVNVGDTIRADAAGASITCSLNGSPVITGPIGATAGRPGLLTDSDTGVLANWSAGPVAQQAGRHRYGGSPTSSAATLIYAAPGEAECAAVFPQTGRVAGDGGGLRSRVLVVRDLAPATDHSFQVRCGEGQYVASGSFTTRAAQAAGSRMVTVGASPPEHAAGEADNLVVDYGALPNGIDGSASAACAPQGRCSAQFPYAADAVVWVRRRWCRDRAGDPGCANPANELARSTAQPVTVP